MRLDFWDGLVLSRDCRVMVPPYSQDQFEKLLTTKNIDFNVLTEDLEPVLEKERRTLKINNHRFSRSAEVDFEHFWSFSEFESYANYLASEYPNLVKKEIIGKSAEGRNIFALKISKNENFEEFGKNPVIFMESGIHARSVKVSQNNLKKYLEIFL